MIPKSMVIVLGLFWGLVACNKVPEKEDSKEGKQPVVQAETPARDRAVVQGKEPTYGNYCNARYSYCIDYPQSFSPQPEATNGDGRVFLNPEDSATLTVYGTRGVDFETEQPRSIHQNYDLDIQGVEEAGGEVTYRKLGDSFYVLSGHNSQGLIFYQKTIVTHDEQSGSPSFAYAVMEYPASHAKAYVSVCTKIFKMFKPS